MMISKDLFLSILAMDAYNQGYGRGIIHGADQAGSAKRNADPSEATLDTWQNASFYALSYTITNDSVDGLDAGPQVLSFRGTDYYANPEDPLLHRVIDWTADIFKGWSPGGGRVRKRQSGAADHRFFRKRGFGR